MKIFSAAKIMPALVAGLVFLTTPAPLKAAEPAAKAGQAAPPVTDPAKTVVARVNGKDITMMNINIAVGNMLPSMAFHASVPEEKYKAMEKQALDKIINDELIYKAAKEAKEDKVESKEIDSAVKDLKKNLPKGETLDKVLKRSSMTMEDLKDDIRQTIVVKRYTGKNIGELRKVASSAVTEAYMKDYYSKNMRKFKEPEQYHLRTMLIKADPSGGQRVWNEALTKAQDLAKKARAGEDFAGLAKNNSQDPFKDRGGDMGWTHKGSLFEEIDDAAGKLKVGQVSDPIMTIYGYHVIKLEGKKPSVQRKFGEINREKLKKELEDKEFRRLWDGWVKSLKDKATIEYLSEIRPGKK